MFDHLFACRRARQRHITSPLLQERLDYLQHCAGQGYSPATLRVLATDLLLVQNLLGLTESSQELDPATVKTAIEKWAGREPKYFSYKNGRGRDYLPHRAIRWLRYMDRLQISRPNTSVYGALIDDFVSHMRQQRGLSEVTIEGRCWIVGDFLGWFFRDHLSLADITIAEIDEAVARKGRDDGYSRSSVKTYASGIRNFFRHAESKGWCRQGLSNLIVSPRVYQSENLPSGPSWDDVQRVIATTKAGRPKDLRDHAMLLLFAVYGMRSREVRTLKLEDLDWEKNLIWVARTKSRRAQCYPLVETVGEAILRYLEAGRPNSSKYREVFLTVQAPIQPLRGSSAWTLVAKRLRPLGLPLRHHGPHALRHYAASRTMPQVEATTPIHGRLGCGRAA
jgi:integrase/recombinase XerD